MASRGCPRVRYGVLAALALALAWPALARAQSAVDPNHGVIEATRQLRSLGSVKRVLVIGAHPDDEDTSLLTLLERGMGADAAYLSLNRGEGGQNLIGRELGDGLGLVRTEELLAARRLDGADQFFTRAYDFGYSKSVDETFSFWPRDSLLADVVSIVRRFRPQVVVSIFSGTRRDGHGQHRAAGLLAREAFEIAGDPSRFPEQLAAGLRPWSPLKLYRSTRFDQAATTLRMETGSLDPLYGRSYHQIAMASRSQHRSQDMGRIEELGPRQTRMQLLESRVAAGAPHQETSIFDGVDTTLTGMLGAINSEAARGALAGVLDNYLELLAEARAALTQWQPARAAPQLAESLIAVRRGQELAAGLGPRGQELSFVLGLQEEKLERALLAAAGVVIDAFSDDDLVVPGQGVKVEAEIWNGGSTDIELRGVALTTPFGTRTESIASRARLSAGSLTKSEFEVPIPEDAAPTLPYYLREPRRGAVYNWPADPSVRGLPFEPPLITARVALDIERVPVQASVAVVYRFADQASGEVRRPLRVVPAVSVEVEPAADVWPLDRGGPSVYTVSLRGEAPGGVSGSVRLDAPSGWTVTPAATEFQLRGAGSAKSVEFLVEAPVALTAGAHTFTVTAVTEEGRRYRSGYSFVDYRHIRRQLLYREAKVTVEAFELELPETPPLVGFVPGAGDGAPEAMRAMGLEVDVLDDRAIAASDLSGYDVIVLGIRAYETNMALVENNGRLLEWARAGGTLIVQYQQYTFFRGDFAPYPLSARFPHDRVTDENAPVKLLDPHHPLFQRPNRIGSEDFEGWVQERGLYFPHEWAEDYTPLLETADGGEDPKRGALLIAPLGNGLYIYTGLALFRQLPAGVPGAYRLLINLLSLGERTAF